MDGISTLPALPDSKSGLAALAADSNVYRFFMGSELGLLEAVLQHVHAQRCRGSSSLVNQRISFHGQRFPTAGYCLYDDGRDDLGDHRRGETREITADECPGRSGKADTPAGGHITSRPGQY